jgi:cation diffusion facilitator CzcD-associated flavoprotein CzcO
MKQYFAVIAGSGFAGLAAAHKLFQLDHKDILILERNDQLGGVWNENRYPGVECDIPSHLYSYSFHVNPDWSKRWAGGSEILKYLVDFAKQNGIYEKIQFRQSVKSATYQEGYWVIETVSGDQFQAKYFISALGQNSMVQLPEIPGLDQFKGQCFHSARWPKGLQIKGQRAAIIGTGASAAQIIITTAPELSKLVVFQRSAAWVVPKTNIPYSEAQKKDLHNPVVAAQERKAIRADYEHLWSKLHYSKENTDFENEVRQMMTEKLSDPELRKKLIPDYPIMTKRLLAADGYLETFSLPQVELNTSGISHIEGQTVIDKAGKKYDLDLIICATGFHATKFLAGLQVKGRDGLDLHKVWRNGLDAEAFYGTLVSGFPNMFMIFGPNTRLGHGSIVDMIESQVTMIGNCIEHVEKNNLASIEVKADVQRVFNEEIQSYMQKLVWTTDKGTTWYRTEEGKVTTTWPLLVSEFERRTKLFNPSDYGFTAVKKSRAA